jgi:hypothetical protein
MSTAAEPPELVGKSARVEKPAICTVTGTLATSGIIAAAGAHNYYTVEHWQQSSEVNRSRDNRNIKGVNSRRRPATTAKIKARNAMSQVHIYLQQLATQVMTQQNN